MKIVIFKEFGHMFTEKNDLPMNADFAFTSLYMQIMFPDNVENNLAPLVTNFTCHLLRLGVAFSYKIERRHSLYATIPLPV